MVIAHKISNAIVAATRDVILFTSNGGGTSTTSAPIKFKSDLYKSNFGSIEGDCENSDQSTYYPSNSAEFTYPSIPGQLLLFSSTITHMVPINMSDKKRMSIAFNTYPKLPFGNRLGVSYLRG